MPNPPASGLPHPQSYDSSSGDRVTDRVTGLVWQRAVDPVGFDWAAAAPYCAGLSLGGLGSDAWRVPTLIELVSIVDFTRVMPAIDPDAFPGTPSLPFWSSQPDVTNLGLAWYVYFSNGGAYGANDIVDVQRVRCVNGPPSRGATDTGAGASCTTTTAAVVRDAHTKLVWERMPPATSYAWTEAQAYCASLTLDQATWRLPSINELMTIVDVNRVDPAIDTAAFPGTPSELFWSSSRALSTTTPAAWGVSFNRGSAGAAAMDTPQYVRCVH